MAEQEVIAATSVDDTTTTAAANLKRKLEDLDEPLSAAPVAAPDSSELVTTDNVNDDPSKRPRLDEQINENGHKAEGENGHSKENADAEADMGDVETAVDDQADGDESTKDMVPIEGNEVQPMTEVEQKGDAQNENPKEIDAQNLTSGEDQLENIEKTCVDETAKPASEVAAEGDVASDGQNLDSGSKSSSRKIEILNNKVGVLIGKCGETIKHLQFNSGAKIQITRDADADPRSATRTVEILGTSENVNKAEMLIRNVIAEADAGGSPSLVARGFSASTAAGFTEVEIPVPGDKVGLIIGRGGDTIKNLQTRSGARIQLITQKVPGEQSEEKKVKITGDKRQIQVARELIMEVMNQIWLLPSTCSISIWVSNRHSVVTVVHRGKLPGGRSSQFSGSHHSQQGYPPRGPGGASQWGNRGPPTQPMPYDYHHQRGPHPSQNQQYQGQYGNYPYQCPPRGNSGSGWEHRPQAHGPTHGGGYVPHSAHASGPSITPPPHSHGNYNYGQPRGTGYAPPTSYSQTPPPVQNYGHGYGDPKYNAQAPVQQPSYGGQGYIPPQQGYATPQQQYSRPPPFGAPQVGYAPPTASQPSDTPYQGPATGPAPTQQYPYAPGATTQPPYGSAPVTNDAYSQPQQVAGYTQPGAQAQPVPAYGQPSAQAQPVPAYGQPGTQTQPAPAYGQQAAGYAYGYQGGQVDPSGYAYQGQADPSAYAAGGAYSGAPAPAAQAGYAPPIAVQPSYDQSAAQTGAYASAAPAAPGVAAQPQPGYLQYDASQQMYAAPR